jgi:hypothetical protein
MILKPHDSANKGPSISNLGHFISSFQLVSRRYIEVPDEYEKCVVLIRNARWGVFPFCARRDVVRIVSRFETRFDPVIPPCVEPSLPMRKHDGLQRRARLVPRLRRLLLSFLVKVQIGRHQRQLAERGEPPHRDLEIQERLLRRWSTNRHDASEREALTAVPCGCKNTMFRMVSEGTHSATCRITSPGASFSMTMSVSRLGGSAEHAIASKSVWSPSSDIDTTRKKSCTGRPLTTCRRTSGVE